MSDWSKLRDWIHRTLGRRSKTDFLIMLLVGVLVMVIAIPTGEKKESPPAGEMQQEEVQDESGLTQWKEDYRSGLEEQLKELLQAMDGVGSCRVMITLEDDGQTYVDKNLRADESAREDETVVYRQGEGEEPYVVRQRMPKVAGVVVVAQGGENAKVITDISNAVMSLFQIEAHKITVVKMSVQEE